MKRYFFILFVCAGAVALSVARPALAAQEVTLSHAGITLNANLELAPGKELAEGVILITHGGLAHNGMEIMVTLQSLFKDHGYSSLAINLSLGIDNRHGMYDCNVTHRHHNSDSSEEIDT